MNTAINPTRGWRFGRWIFLWIGLCACGTYPVQAHENPNASASLPVLYSAPELTGLTDWINSPPVNSMQDLKGRVVLVDFWTYSCINCIHTFPYLQEWHERYAKQGLVVLGVHAPEFSFERKPENVREAVKKHGLTFPVALDNGFQTWRAYRNQYWPAFYLVDHRGQVRYMHFGEGRYQETESAIRQLLADASSH